VRFCLRHLCQEDRMTATPADDVSGFFEKNYDRIYRYIKGMVRDANEAEDLTQEAFLRAHRERETVRDPGAMLSWLYRIATHASLDRLRQRAKAAAQEAKVDLAAIDPPDPGTPSIQQALEQEQMGDCVNRFLVGIPDEHRSVILLHDMHGLTGPEIAEFLALPLSTVKIRLHRARRQLKDTLTSGCKFSLDSRGVLVCEPKK
jgi:RNA polymerase sigma-70 factor (ECF subfamily)